MRKFKDVGRSEGQDQVVHRETRYLGVKWPQRHNLMFDEKTIVDMWEVCLQDVTKMFIQRGREVQCKEWAAKHECEELKEGVWIEPMLMMQKKEVERVVDEQAPQRDEEVGDGRRLGAEAASRY